MYELIDVPKQRRSLWGRLWSFVWKAVLVLLGVWLALVVAMALWPDEPAKLPPTSGDVDGLRAGAEVEPYERLARFTELYQKAEVSLYYTGQVVQVIEQDGLFALRVNVTKTDSGYDDAIMLFCVCSPRPLESDIVEFVAKVDGRQSYESIFGETITIPALTAEAYRRVSE